MKKVVSINLDIEVINLLKKISRETDVPITRLVQRALIEVYGNYKGDKKK